MDVTYLLAGVAVSLPALLVVQTFRGRVRIYCCSGSQDPRCDLRMRAAYEKENRSRLYE